MPYFAPPGAKERHIDTETCPVTVPGATERIVQCEAIGSPFVVSVAVPPGFDPGEGAPLKVVYTLSANMSFASAVETARLAAFARELPPLLIVGIGYDRPRVPYGMDLRMRDFTPTPEQGLYLPGDDPGRKRQAGGAHAFLDFMEGTVKPLVEREYGADPADATIQGHSVGGLLGLTALFQRPGIFQRYVLGSPSIWWDHGVALSYEAEYAAVNTDLPARVFISAGGLEEEGDSAPAKMITNVREMARRLESRGYPGLRLTSHVFEGETHASVNPATVSRGLRSVFAE